MPRYVDAGLIAPFDAGKVPNATMFSPTMDWVNRLTVGSKLRDIPCNWGT